MSKPGGGVQNHRASCISEPVSEETDVELGACRAARLPTRSRGRQMAHRNQHRACIVSETTRHLSTPQTGIKVLVVYLPQEQERLLPRERSQQTRHKRLQQETCVQMGIRGSILTAAAGRSPRSSLRPLSHRHQLLTSRRTQPVATW